MADEIAEIVSVLAEIWEDGDFGDEVFCFLDDEEKTEKSFFFTVLPSEFDTVEALLAVIFLEEFDETVFLPFIGNASVYLHPKQKGETKSIADTSVTICL